MLTCYFYSGAGIEIAGVCKYILIKEVIEITGR
jgi:hypothetical protein